MESANFLQLVNKLETLVQRFESALGGSAHPTIPVDAAPVSAAPAQPAPAKAAQAPAQAKVNPVIEAFEKEVLSKVKAMEDAAKALPGEIVKDIVS